MASGDDGSVEILVTGTVDASVAAAGKEATATFDAVSAKAVEATQAQASRISAMVDRSIAEMNAKASEAKAATGALFESQGSRSGVAAQNAAMGIGASGSIALDAVETKTEEVAASTGGLKLATSGAIQEYIRLGHEALTGNFSRMPGSLIVLASRTGGLQSAFSALTPAMIAGGAAIAGVGAAAIAAGVALYQYDEHERELTASTFGLGAASMVTADQIKASASAASSASGQSYRSMVESSEAFAASGLRTEGAIATLSGMVQIYAALTGQKAADAQKALAEAMRDPVKGAQDLNEQLGILDNTQLKQIETMVAHGDKVGADNVIMQALKQRTDEASTAGVGANTVFQTMTSTLSNLWNALGSVTPAMQNFSDAMAMGFVGGDQIAAQHAKIKKAGEDAQRQDRLNTDSKDALPLTNNTPEARDETKREELKGQIDILQRALQADKQLGNAGGVRRDTAALNEYTRALKTFHGEAERGHIIAQLDAKIADAKHAHNEQAVADLTKQREMENLGGQVMSEGDVNTKATDAANTARERGAPRAKAGPGMVQQWTEQLHEQEVASNNFFKDNTADELAFWQGKVGVVKSGSKEWMEVQSKIFEASKTLARTAYAEMISNDNEKIASDKGNWSAQLADYQKRLADIKGTMGEQSSEYHNAYREMETAQFEHAQTELRQQEEAGAKLVASVKQQVEDEKRINDETAKIKVLQIKDQSEATPFSGAAAARQESAAKQEAIAEEIAGLAKLQAATDANFQEQEAKALAAGKAGADAYTKMVAAKIAADADFAAKNKALQDRMLEQQLAGIAAQKAAYTGYISGTVNATISGFDKMISGQMTWRQFGISVYQSVAREAIQQVEKMATEWIVKHVLMAAASKLLGDSQSTTSDASVAATAATSKAQVASLAGVAGAGGVASMAAAPWPLDMDAPSFGAEMAAAAMSLGSFAQGTNIVPNDMIAQIHQGERIIPKADNDQIISAVRNGTGGGDGGGDTHNHFSPTLHANGVDGKSVMAALESNFSDFTGLMKRAQRNGAFR